MKWDQGSFDMAIYFNGILIMLQFTVSKKHSLKLEYVKELHNAFKSRGIDVETVAHIGINKDGKLKWEAATGTRGQTVR